MAVRAWDVDLFGWELTATLVATLSGSPDAAVLQRAVVDCAAAPDAICGERPVDCGPGCPHCCVLNAAILLPEGMIIADWLQQQLPPASLMALRDRLTSHRCWVRWMDDEERILKHATCPLLDTTGRCGIHPVRPLVCRAAASLDRNSCREAFSPMHLDQDRLVPVDLLRQTAYDAAFVALANALLHQGIDDRSIELGTGVLAFLERPDCRELLLSGDRLPQALWE